MSTSLAERPARPLGPTGRAVPGGAPAARRGARRGLRLGLLAVLALLAVATYFVWRLPLGSDYLVQRRALTVTTMVVVASAIACATVLFHTVTANRILTPSIMGLDALYLALQTASVFFLGSRQVHPVLSWLVVLAAMVGFSLLLFTGLLVGLKRSVTLMVMVGVLLGGLFRGLSGFMQRMLDPEAFIVLSDRFFADFTGRDPRLVAASAVVVLLCCGWAWRSRRELDVVALGREVAIGLGVDHRRASLRALVVVAVLVGTATALVGPTMFFGLLVAHLGYRVVDGHGHAATLPAAVSCAVVALVGGQLLFERVLGLEGSLSMVVEFCGGITFLVLLLRQTRAGRLA